MKPGTKVSWSQADGTHAQRVYGMMLGDAGDELTLVSPTSLTKVSPVLVVPTSRVAEVIGDESEDTHERRLRKEAADREIAAAKAKRTPQAS